MCARSLFHQEHLCPLPSVCKTQRDCIKKEEAQAWLLGSRLGSCGRVGGVQCRLSVCVMVGMVMACSKVVSVLKRPLPLWEEVHQYFSNCGPWTSSVSLPWELFRNKLSGPILDRSETLRWACRHVQYALQGLLMPTQG